MCLWSDLSSQLALYPRCVQGQCSGTETFEKVTRTTVRGITGIPLFSNAGNTVTSDCLSRCRQSRSCSGFLLNYDRESCFRLDRVAYSSGAALQPTLEPINFFEKICITASPCGKDWMLERVVGFEIEGYDDIVLNNVPDRLKCAELCIREKGLQCRSAEYHTRDNVCRLSRQDRRTQPLSFRPASPHVMYIENQCAPATQQQQCEFEEFPAQDLGHGDKQIAVRSKEECLQACESEAAFNCRSFAWYERAGVCRLSGTTSSPRALQRSGTCRAPRGCRGRRAWTWNSAALSTP
nr:uncharacterized protein LOC113822325 [Penaeus vannamei]